MPHGQQLLPLHVAANRGRFAAIAAAEPAAGGLVAALAHVLAVATPSDEPTAIACLCALSALCGPSPAAGSTLCELDTLPGRSAVDLAPAMLRHGVHVSAARALAHDALFPHACYTLFCCARETRTADVRAVAAEIEAHKGLARAIGVLVDEAASLEAKIAGMQALTVLTCAPTSAQPTTCIEQASVIPAVLALLTAHRGCLPVQLYGCWLLTNLAASSRRRSAMIVASRGAATVTYAMARHPFSASLQRTAALLLAFLIFNLPEHTSLFEDAGVVGALQCALRRHGTVPAVVHACCWSLANLTKEDERAPAAKQFLCARLASRGMVELVLGCASTHCMDASACGWALGALANMCAFGAGRARALACHTGGGVFAFVAQCMAGALRDYHVQWHGCLALANLSEALIPGSAGSMLLPRPVVHLVAHAAVQAVFAHGAVAVAAQRATPNLDMWQSAATLLQNLCRVDMHARDSWCRAAIVDSGGIPLCVTAIGFGARTCPSKPAAAVSLLGMRLLAAVLARYCCNAVLAEARASGCVNAAQEAMSYLGHWSNSSKRDEASWHCLFIQSLLKQN